LVDRLRLKPVSSGANVTLIEPYDEGVLYGAREIERAPVVSPVQLYLDLTKTKGRGEEAASASHALATLGGRAEVCQSGPSRTSFVILVHKVSPTPDAYPRRPGIPQRRPLA
jgi:hypothetical protein